MKGQRILMEGNVSQRIFFVKEGKIKIYKTDKSGHELILRFAKKGDIIGFGDLDTVSGQEESAMAIDETILCCLDQNVFVQLVRLYPELAIELLNFYRNELRNSEIKNFKLARLNVPGKVADALLTMYEAYGGNGNDHTINLVLSRQEIANLAGTTKEQVSKVLSEFHDQGIIHTKSKQIDILKMESLKALARI